MSGLKQFQHQAARPLPIIVLTDISGSMSVDGKIEALNTSLANMIGSFGKEVRIRAELQISVITFGGNQADIHLPLTPAHKIERFQGLTAQGATPMGSAFKIAHQLIEDKSVIPSRAYKPVVILVSDGHPTDEWQSSFTQLMEGERSSTATRFALAIGDDADENMLSEFANDLEAPVFRAENSSDIYRFFKAVTMSVTACSQSSSPNQSIPLTLPPIENSNDEDWEF